MDNIEIGQYLSKIRQRKGITQAQEAEMLGVTNKAVSKWECGESLPSVDLLMAIAKLYGTSVDNILSSGRIEEEAVERAITSNATVSANPEKEKISNEKVGLALHISNIAIAALGILIGLCLAGFANVGAALITTLVLAILSLGLYLSAHIVGGESARKFPAVSLGMFSALIATLIVIFSYAVFFGIATPISIFYLCLTDVDFLAVSLATIIPLVVSLVVPGAIGEKESLSYLRFASIIVVFSEAIIVFFYSLALNHEIYTWVAIGVSLLLLILGILSCFFRIMRVISIGIAIIAPIAGCLFATNVCQTAAYVILAASLFAIEIIAICLKKKKKVKVES